MPNLLSSTSARKLAQLLDKPHSPARAGRGVDPGQLPVVLCGTLISSSPQPHYNGTVQWLADVDGPADAGVSTVVLTALNGETLTPGRYYHAIPSGLLDGVLIFWTTETGSGAGAVSQWKAPVAVATTENGTLSSAFENGKTVDGVTLSTGGRILIKNQTAGAENGIYTVNASGAPTRATDCDTDVEVIGAVVDVTSGTVNGGTVWNNTNTSAVIIGTTAITWGLVGPQAAAEATNGSNVNMTVDNTYVDAVTIDLPSGHGKYLLYAIAAINASTTSSFGTITARLYNSTAGTEIAYQHHTTGPDGQDALFPIPVQAVVTITASGTTTIKLQTKRGNGPTYSNSSVNTNAPSRLGYVRLG